MAFRIFHFEKKPALGKSIVRQKKAHVFLHASYAQCNIKSKKNV